MVANTFYRPEEALIIDILLKHPCIREDDLIELLKFDKKHVRTYSRTHIYRKPRTTGFPSLSGA